MLLRINILSLLVMLARAPRLCDALTYRLDASCVARPGQFTVALNEAIFMARSAADRLSSETDRLHQSYFQLIFKQPARNGITSPLLSQLSVASSNAIDFFEMVGGLIPTIAQELSDIRFHCDNDPTGPGQRWTLIPDIPNDPNPNSARPPANQEWEDVGNLVRITGLNAGSKGCRPPPGPGSIQAYGHTIKGKSLASNTQNPNRAVVTICDSSLNAHFHALSDFPTKADLTAHGNTLDSISSLTSVTILHELTHALPFERRDFFFPAIPGAIPPVPDRDSYVWTNVLLLNPAQSVENAENYAFFGLLSRLSDRGFRLFITGPGRAAGKFTYNPPEITSKIKRLIKLWKA